MKLFLDDDRYPHRCNAYMDKRIGDLSRLYDEKWHIVRNFDEFCEFVVENHEHITHVSFDHDLADTHYDPSTWTESFKYKEKTGYDCAKWFKEFYQSKNKSLPIMFVHSMNPIGTQKIINLFK